jgi:hypothetical protein
MKLSHVESKLHIFVTKLDFENSDDSVQPFEAFIEVIPNFILMDK